MPVCLVTALLCVILFVLTINSYGLAELSNDIEDQSRNNLPKPVSYFTFPTIDETLQTTEKLQEARFTYPNSAAGLDIYGTSALSQGLYPFKLDIGGLILGAFVGIGALLLIPKIMHILVPELALYGNTYGPPYKRDLDSSPIGLTQMISQFEKALSQNNINSSECLQKAICSYVQSTKRNGTSQTTNADNELAKDYFLGNYLVNLLIDGSKLQRAIENGKQDIGCGILYSKCPFNQIMNRIKRLLFEDNTEEENK